MVCAWQHSQVHDEEIVCIFDASKGWDEVKCMMQSRWKSQAASSQSFPGPSPLYNRLATILLKHSLVLLRKDFTFWLLHHYGAFPSPPLSYKDNNTIASWYKRRFQFFHIWIITELSCLPLPFRTNKIASVFSHPVSKWTWANIYSAMRKTSQECKTALTSQYLGLCLVVVSLVVGLKSQKSLFVSKF